MNDFNTYLNNLDYSHVKDLFARKGILRTYHKKDFFIRQNEVERFAGWVKHGTFQYTHIDEEGEEYDAAFELYKHCLDIYPGSAPALYEISQFYMVLGQEQKGEEALKKAVRSDESNFWYKQTLAAYYQRKRDWAKAIAVYDDMAHQFPSRL